MRPKKWTDEAAHITKIGAETTPQVINRQQEDVPDIEKLTDRQLAAHLCSRYPMCMTCEVDVCRFGKEYRKRVKNGTWGTMKKRE